MSRRLLFAGLLFLATTMRVVAQAPSQCPPLPEAQEAALWAQGYQAYTILPPEAASHMRILARIDRWAKVCGFGPSASWVDTPDATYIAFRAEGDTRFIWWLSMYTPQLAGCLMPTNTLNYAANWQLYRWLAQLTPRVN